MSNFTYVYILTCTRPLDCIVSTNYFNNSTKTNISNGALHSMSIKIQHSALAINRQGRIITTIALKTFLESKDFARVDYRITFTRLWS